MAGKLTPPNLGSLDNDPLEVPQPKPAAPTFGCRCGDRNHVSKSWCGRGSLLRQSNYRNLPSRRMF